MPNTTIDQTAGTADQTASGDAVDFEKWIASQPDDVKAAFETHVGGLKSALKKERDARKEKVEKKPSLTKGVMERIKARKAEAASKTAATPDAAYSKKIAELKDENKRLTERQRMLEARDALLLAADQEKIPFATLRAQQDAIKFALESASFDDQGKIVDPKAALTDALKERQFLIKPTQPAPPTTNASDRGKSSGEVIDEARLMDIKKRFHMK